MLSVGNICAFDLDKCRDPKTGALAPWARKLLEECRSYAEITPSGTGLRIIGYGRGDKCHKKIKLEEKLVCLPEAGSLEIYRKATRYITITGDALDGYNVDLVNIDAAIDRLSLASKVRETKGNAPKDNGAKRAAPDWILALVRSNETGERGMRLFEVVVRLKVLGWTPDEIEALFLEHPGAVLEKYERRMRTEIDRAYGKIEVNEEWTDLGNARRLVRRHGENIRYVNDYKAWFIWKKNYWKRDNDGEIMRLAADTVEAMFDQAQEMADADARAKFRKFILQSQGRRYLENMVALARWDAHVVLATDALDADPMLLGVQNGVINLNTREFTEGGHREDYITKRCAVAYDPAAKCPNWEAFQIKITGNNTEVMEYKQRAFGLGLTGEMVEVLFLMWGEGANGKTTEAETNHDLLGDYACAANASLLISAHEKGGATPEVVALKGCREVFIRALSEHADSIKDSI